VMGSASQDLVLLTGRKRTRDVTDVPQPASTPGRDALSPVYQAC
jgi:hypothetical protein